jgi:hypothetical protein
MPTQEWLQARKVRDDAEKHFKAETKKVRAKAITQVRKMCVEFKITKAMLKDVLHEGRGPAKWPPATKTGKK